MTVQMVSSPSSNISSTIAFFSNRVQMLLRSVAPQKTLSALLGFWTHSLNVTGWAFYINWFISLAFSCVLLWIIYSILFQRMNTLRTKTRKITASNNYSIVWLSRFFQNFMQLISRSSNTKILQYFWQIRQPSRCIANSCIPILVNTTVAIERTGKKFNLMRFRSVKNKARDFLFVACNIRNPGSKTWVIYRNFILIFVMRFSFFVRAIKSWIKGKKFETIKGSLANFNSGASYSNTSNFFIGFYYHSICEPNSQKICKFWARVVKNPVRSRSTLKKRQSKFLSNSKYSLIFAPNDFSNLTSAVVARFNQINYFVVVIFGFSHGAIILQGER